VLRPASLGRRFNFAGSIAGVRDIFFLRLLVFCRLPQKFLTGRRFGGGTECRPKPSSFRAVDIYRVPNEEISDNWHLEDHVSLMQQLGVGKPQFPT
jgi:SnoaL-like polyketide cyclase